MGDAFALARGRQLAESLMVDASNIKRPTGKTTDPDTGEVATTYTTLYTNQKCRVQHRGQWGERRDVGQDSVVMQTVEVKYPITVTGLRPDDVIEFVASAHDPALVGQTLLIKDVPAETHATCRRVMGTELTD